MPRFEGVASAKKPRRDLVVTIVLPNPFLVSYGQFLHVVE